MDAKNEMAILVAKTGLFFANCDGVYDEREKKFIENFIAELKNEGSDVTDDALALIAKSIDSIYTLSEIISETKAYLAQFNSDEKKAILDVFSDFISKVINADSVLVQQETDNFAQWKAALYE